MAKNSIGNLSVIISASTSGLSAALKRSQSMVAGFSAQVNRASASATSALSTIGKGINFANPLAGLTPSFEGLKTAGVAALTGLSVYSVKLAADAEQTQVSFETMLGSASEAGKLIADIKRVASETPFGSKELLDASKQLVAYGTAADQIVPTLRLLGDISAGVSQPLGEVAYLYGTLQTQGRAYTKDIQQFAGRGIGVYEELGKVLKVDKEAVGKLVEEGKVGFREVQSALQGLTKEGGRFSGLMAKQSQTLSGLFEGLKDNAVLALEEIGKVMIEEFDLKGLTRQATEWTKDLKNRVGELRPLFREIADWAKAIGNAISVGFRSAWVAAEGFISGINAAFDLTTKAMNFKDYLKGLQFDFKAARDVGIGMAQNVAVGLGRIIDTAEEVSQAIRQIYLGILKLDQKQFALKRALNPFDDSDKEIKGRFSAYQSWSQDAVNATIADRDIAKSKPTLRKNGQMMDQGAWERTALANTYRSAAPDVAKQMQETSRQIEATIEAMRRFDRIAVNDPDLAIREKAGKQVAELNKQYGTLASDWIQQQAKLEAAFKKSLGDTTGDQIVKMQQEIESFEKSIKANSGQIGKHTDSIRKSFADLGAANAKSDLAQMLGQRVTFGDVAAKVLKFNVAFEFRSAFDGMQKWLDSHSLKAPIQTASAEQRELARQLMLNTKSPLDSFKDEMAKLDELLKVRAFGGNIAANLLGSGLADLAQIRGAQAIGIEAARKFKELESSLGLGQPKLPAAIVRGSTQAASIEAQFSVAGQPRDPQARVEAVLRLIDEKHSKELIELRSIAQSLKDFLRSQPQNFDFR